MSTLIVTLCLVIFTFSAPTKAAIVIGLAVILGFVVQLITSFIAKPVSLIQSIKAVFLSIVAMFIAAMFSVQVLASAGPAFPILGLIVVVLASCAAFSLCLEINLASSLIVSLLFWGIAYPVLGYFGVAALRATA